MVVLRGKNRFSKNVFGLTLKQVATNLLKACHQNLSFTRTWEKDLSGKRFNFCFQCDLERSCKLQLFVDKVNRSVF
jgi:hypothetical protein